MRIILLAITLIVANENFAQNSKLLYDEDLKFDFHEDIGILRTTIEEKKKEVRKGSAKFCFFLGESYRLGIGVKQNFAKSLKYFKKGIDQNQNSIWGGLCDYHCALLSIYDLGNNENTEVIKQHLLAAIAQKVPEAQYNIGTMYYKGNLEFELKQNWFKADSLLKQLDDKSSRRIVAMMHSTPEIRGKFSPCLLDFVENCIKGDTLDLYIEKFNHYKNYSDFLMLLKEYPHYLKEFRIPSEAPSNPTLGNDHLKFTQKLLEQGSLLRTTVEEYEKDILSSSVTKYLDDKCPFLDINEYVNFKIQKFTECNLLDDRFWPKLNSILTTEQVKKIDSDVASGNCVQIGELFNSFDSLTDSYFKTEKQKTKEFYIQAINTCTVIPQLEECLSITENDELSELILARAAYLDWELIINNRRLDLLRDFIDVHPYAPEAKTAQILINQKMENNSYQDIENLYRSGIVDTKEDHLFVLYKLKEISTFETSDLALLNPELQLFLQNYLHVCATDYTQAKNETQEFNGSSTIVTYGHIFKDELFLCAPAFGWKSNDQWKNILIYMSIDEPQNVVQWLFSEDFFFTENWMKQNEKMPKELFSKMGTAGSPSIDRHHSFNNESFIMPSYDQRVTHTRKFTRKGKATIGLALLSIVFYNELDKLKKSGSSRYYETLIDCYKITNSPTDLFNIKGSDSYYLECENYNKHVVRKPHNQEKYFYSDAAKVEHEFGTLEEAARFACFCD